MKKRILAMLLAGALALSGLAGCQESGDTGAAEESGKTEETAGEEPEEAAEEADDGEVNEYGFTGKQQEALLASVKESVTTLYLEPFGIDPSEFQLTPYDVNEVQYYESTPTADGYETVYSGSEPYECSWAWEMANTVIAGTEHMDWTAGDSTSLELLVEDLIEEDGFAATMEEQNQKNYPPYILDASAQRTVLADALYRGITQFLNGLEPEECAELMVRLFEKVDEAGTTVVQEREVGNATLFDRVVSENIEF